MAKRTTKKGKKGRKGKSNVGDRDTAGATLKRLLKFYEQNCAEIGTAVYAPLKRTIKDYIEEDRLMVKLFMEGVPQLKPDALPVSLGPILTAIRLERYVYLQGFYVWDMPLLHHDVTMLALMLEKGIYPLKVLELMDCLLQADSLKRLAMSFNACALLTTVVLDYNDFGDAGCKAVCSGLVDNTVLLSLSMCYCNLGVDSGQDLGKIICETALRDLYLDGNNLECEGAAALIKMCVDKAENEMFEKKEEERLQEEERTAVASDRERNAYVDVDADGLNAAEKKPKGKKRKKKGPSPPPIPGPWIHKLHLLDNGIDMKGEQGELATQMCMQLFAKLISNSRCLVEIDLEDNLIGELGGSQLLKALQNRAAEKLPPMKLRTTHRVDEETFTALVALGGGLQKKKRKKKK